MGTSWKQGWQLGRPGLGLWHSLPRSTTHLVSFPTPAIRFSSHGAPNHPLVPLYLSALVDCQPCTVRARALASTAYRGEAGLPHSLAFLSRKQGTEPHRWILSIIPASSERCGSRVLLACLDEQLRSLEMASWCCLSLCHSLAVTPCHRPWRSASTVLSMWAPEVSPCLPFCCTSASLATRTPAIRVALISHLSSHDSVVSCPPVL